VNSYTERGNIRNQIFKKTLETEFFQFESRLKFFLKKKTLAEKVFFYQKKLEPRNSIPGLSFLKKNSIRGSSFFTEKTLTSNRVEANVFFEKKNVSLD
jgi:hypothetical protein